MGGEFGQMPGHEAGRWWVLEGQGKAQRRSEAGQEEQREQPNPERFPIWLSGHHKTPQFMECSLCVG